MNESKILSLAKDEKEIIFIKKYLDIFKRVEMRGNRYLSDFLDPGQVYLLEEMVKYNKKLSIRYCEEFEYLERKRVIISESIELLDSIHYKVSVIKIVSSKFSRKLTHRDYLGSILGVGIIRDKIGDILVTKDNNAYIYLDTSILDYIKCELKKVGRENVVIENVESIKNEIINVIDNTNVERIIVNSERIDIIIAKVFNISRKKVNNLIKLKKVKLNFRIELSNHKMCKDNDLISVRGYRRIKILKRIGVTKKNNVIFEVQV